jgi:uncharacterized oxidoreductase
MCHERIAMDLASNSVLITGGASGIGFALAERFLQAGSEVIICGRRPEQLRAAQEKQPRIRIRVCDVAKESDRLSLCRWAVGEFAGLNVLVNNAGIQRRLDLAQLEEWEHTRQEIAINFEAPVHLSNLLIPHLLKQQRPAILNVTSGLGFVPMARVPIYSATKAALHSFTLSLRHQLSHTPIQIVEIIPPAVNTDLGGPGLHTFGVALDEFADAVMAGMRNGDLEISYGFAEQASRASRAQLDELFTRMNQSGS